MKLRNILAWALILCLFCGTVSATEPQESTDGLFIEAVGTGLPDSWNPLGQRTEDADRILALTAEPLYRLSADGTALTPGLAAELPQDVTESYAGTFGIPENAKRGYAFSITLRSDALWEDGTAINASDLTFPLEIMLKERTLSLPLANLQAFFDGKPKAGDEILSLSQAGFATLEEAKEAGHSLFYVDAGHFWGLDTGWVSIHDRTRLKDRAIPSGVTEMYVSGAYLFDRYLKTGAGYQRYQRDFIGIATQAGQVSWEDVGLLTTGTREILLILETPATAEGLALTLKDLVPLRQDLYGANYGTSADTYLSSGPYRIVSFQNGEMILQPNPLWTGTGEVVSAHRIRITS